MKKSIYNIEFERGDYDVVYNLLSAKFVRINKKRRGSLSENQIQVLVENGFFVPNETDEKLRLDFDNQKRIWQTNEYWDLTILTTLNCNAKCYYCYEKNAKCLPNYSQNDIAVATANFIKKNADGRIVDIEWFGGEPLLNTSRIDEIIGLLKRGDVNYESSIVTNGVLISSEIVQKMLTWKTRHVQVTLDAVGERHEEIKGIHHQGGAIFRRVIDNVKMLIKKKIRTSLRVNYSPTRIKDALEAIEYIFREFGNDDFLDVYCWCLYGDEHSYTKDNNEHLQVIRKLIECKYITAVTDSIEPRIVPCNSQLFDRYVICHNGNLYKDTFELVDDLSVGNVWDGIKYNQNLLPWIQWLPLEKCKLCVVYPICHGGCKRVADKKCIALNSYIVELVSLFYDMLYAKSCLTIE